MEEILIVTQPLNIAATEHVLRDGQQLRYAKTAEIGLIWALAPMCGFGISVPPYEDS